MLGKNRDLTLTPRKEDVRDKRPAQIAGAVRFSLESIHNHFLETLEAIEKLFSVADELGKKEQCEERDNTWRAQIVFLAGAFDFFMHEITKYGLTQIILGIWEPTKKYKHFTICMEIVEQGLQAEPEDVRWFHDYVNTHYSTCTMISHSEVKAQLNLLGIDCASLAKKAFYKEGDKNPVSVKLKNRLNQLFARRNLIAHQVDRAHEDAKLFSIEKYTVVEFIKDVKKIVNCIYDMSKDKDRTSS